MEGIIHIPWYVMCFIQPDNHLPTSFFFLPIKLHVHLVMNSQAVIFEVGLKNISRREFAPKRTERALQSRTSLLPIAPFLLFSTLTKPTEDISHPLYTLPIHIKLPDFLLVPIGKRLLEVTSEEWDAPPVVVLERVVSERSK